LCSARATVESSRWMASSSGESKLRSGAAVSVIQPERHAADLGLFDFFFLCFVCAKALEPARASDTTTAATAKRFHKGNSVLARGTGVGIVAEGVGVAFCEDLHQPAIKVIDWVVHDGFKTPIVFSMSFFNVVT
jgi:hypothetical protein